MYAESFGTGPRWLSCVVQEVTGLVTFLVSYTRWSIVVSWVRPSHVKREGLHGDISIPIRDSYQHLVRTNQITLYSAVCNKKAQ